MINRRETPNRYADWRGIVIQGKADEELPGRISQSICRQEEGSG